MSDKRFNIIKHRGDPKTAVLETGETVKKEEWAYWPSADGWKSARCADYHGEHFVYVHPRFLLEPPVVGQWFAFCTWGSQAIALDAGEARTTHEYDGRENLMVCYIYNVNKKRSGIGAHLTGHRTWW